MRASNASTPSCRNICSKKRTSLTPPPGSIQRPQDGFTVYPFGSRLPEDLQDNERIGIQPHEVNRLLRTAIHQTGGKWVIRQPVTFQNKIYYNLHRLLRAVDKNTLLSKLTPEDIAAANEYFVPQADILAAFRQYPQIITNTFRLIDACSIDMKFGEDKNKKLYSASREDDRVLLEKLAREGFRLRYGNSKKARERLVKGAPHHRPDGLHRLLPHHLGHDPLRP